MANHIPGRGDFHIDAQREPVHVWMQAAKSIGQPLWQHWHHLVHQINGGGAVEGIPVQGGIFPNIVGYVRNMDPQH